MKSKMIKRCLAFALAAVMVVSMLTPASAEAASKKCVKSLKVASTLNVIKGQKRTIKVTVKATKGVSKKVSVKVKNKKIAKATYNAKKSKITVKGLKKGSTTIKVTTKGKNKKGKKISKSIKVTVKKVTPVPTPQPVVQPSVAPIVIQTPTPVVKVQTIQLSATNLQLVRGRKASLSATVLPSNAVNRSITWSTSDENIATISAGIVTAKGKGTATITARNSYSRVSATCQVTVVDSVTVHTQAELNAALQDSDLAELVIETTNDDQFIIPSGEHLGAQLVIHGDSANIANYGSFQSVTLNGGNYLEKGTGNSLTMNKATNINIGLGASTRIYINDAQADENTQINIVNNGTISSLSIAKATNVSVRGDSDNVIYTNITSPDVTLITSQNMKFTLSQKAKLYLIGDTDQTAVVVDKVENKPEIRGTGTIEVSCSEDLSKENVVAGDLDITITVAATGDVKDAYTSDKLEGVTVTLVPYADFTTPDELPVSAITATTDADGIYQFTEVGVGNYYAIMQKEGYKDAVQILPITAKKDTFTNETMELLSLSNESEEATGITGEVLNATNKDKVEGLTVEIRKYKGNVVGEAIASALTDADGKYNFMDLPSDQYTIMVVDNRTLLEDQVGYITARKNVCLKSGSVMEVNMNVSPKMNEGEVRFVLNWASEDDNVPEDLDSHLFGPRPDGDGLFEVYFSEEKYKAYTEDGQENVNLDTDCTNYSGPETVTIVKPIEGVYEYYIHNYYSRPNFLRSGATVDVYTGNQLVASYAIPTTDDDSMRWWHVCSYDSRTGIITDRNRLSNGCDIKKENQINNDSVSVIQNISTGSLNPTVFRYSVDEDFGVEIQSSEAWETLLPELSFETYNGYTATYADPDANSTYGYIVITKGNTELCRYEIYFEQSSSEIY